MIEHLRYAYHNPSDECCGPPRARQLAWSSRRVVDLLRYRGRRPLQLAKPGSAELVGQELTLQALFTAVDAGDSEAALRHAQWLVPTTEVARLVRWAQPVVETGAKLRIAA